MSATYRDFLLSVARSDVTGLLKAERSYGNSWKRRTGIGAFMMLARKWDRIEQRVSSADIATDTAAMLDDIFAHVAADRRVEGIIDDIRDLRRYLILVESEMAARVGGATDSGKGYLDQLEGVTQRDVAAIEQSRRPLPWDRTGTETFRILAERWRRIEERVGTHVEPVGDRQEATRYDVFEHIAADCRQESILEDVRELRRHLLVVEAEMAARGELEIGTARDNREES